MKLFRLIYRFSLLLFLIASMIIVLLYSQLGLQLAVYVAEKITPDELSIESATGYLSGPIHMKHFHMRYKHMVLELQNVNLRINPLKILFNAVDGEFVTVDNMFLHLDPDPTIPFEWDDLSLAINIYAKEIRVKHATIDYIGVKPFELDNVVIKGNLVKEGMYFPTVQADYLKGHLAGEGYIQVRPIVEWQAHLNSRTMNLGMLSTSFPSQLNFKFNGKGYLEQSTVISTLDFSNITGSLLKQPIKGQLNARFSDDVLQQLSHDLNLGKAQLKLNATRLPVLSAQWKISIPELHDLFPSTKGQLNTQGKLILDPNAPHLQGALTAERLGINQLNIAAINSTFNLDGATNHNSELLFTLENARWKSMSLDKLVLSGKGPTQQQNIEVTAYNREQKFHTTLQGRYENQEWQGRITVLTWHDFTGENWHLTQASQLNSRLNHFKLDTLCLASTRGKLCTNFNWFGAKKWAGEFSAKHFPLQQFASLVSPDLLASNPFNLDIKANSDAKGQLHGNGQLDLAAGTITYQAEKPMPALHVQTGSASFLLNENGFVFSTNLQLADNGKLFGRINLPGYKGLGFPTAQQIIDGKLNADIKHIESLSLILPKLEQTQGSLQGEIAINGSLSRPLTTGMLTLSNFKTMIPDLNIKLDNGKAALRLLNNHSYTLDSSVQIGSGKLLLNGNGNWDGNHFSSNINLAGENLLVSNTKEVKILASPQLKMKTQGDALTLEGTVGIPEAKIISNDLGNLVDSSQNLDDVIIVDKNKPLDPGKALNLYSRIHLILGNDIVISYKGLQVNLGGELTITDNPNGLTTATGLLRSEKGQFRAYGQTLDIRQGRLIFTGGPVNNPGIDVQAVKTINTTMSHSIFDLTSASLDSNSLLLSQTPTLSLGINIQNNLRKPIVTLFSEPAGLTQADILSYLILGRPTAQVSHNDSQTLISAASALNIGGNGISSLTQQLQNAFGLNELSIESGATPHPNEANGPLQNTSLVLGKYLTPRLYLNYSIGLLQQINTFRARYTLTQNWVLQGETNSLTKGVDIFYTIELK